MTLFRVLRKRRMKIKTRPDNTESLCNSCREAQIIQGRNFKETRILCSAAPYGAEPEITYPVTSCTDYDFKAAPRLRDLYEAAWILRTDSSTKKIGFTPYKNLTQDEKDRLQ